MKKVVLITGASSGIGMAAAREFLSRGWIVFAGARRVERMRELEKMGARTIRLDVTDDESCRAFVQAAMDSCGRIDALVNNAGYGEYGPVEAVSVERAKAQLEVNVFGAVRMVQAAAPFMRAQKSGVIINISSAGGRVTTYLGGWYHAGKYALESLSDSLRMELSPFGISVVLIEPGGVGSAWGAITADNLSKSGKGTVYERDCDTVAGVYRAVYTEDNRMLTPSGRAAKKIVKAASAKRPRARYLFGFGSHSLLMMKTILPQRAYDSVMRRVYTLKAVQRIAHK